MRKLNRGPVLIIGLSFLASTPLGAPAPVSDSRRDMIKTLEATKPHASLAEQSRLFDPFVGTWNIDYTNFNADGTVTRYGGKVIFGWIIDGWAMQDIWMSYPLGVDKERSIGTSVRFFDRTKNQWRVVWIAPSAGVVTMVEGGAVGDGIVLTGRDENGAIRRWSFSDIRPDSFVWRGERSRDNGLTWKLEAEYHITREGTREASE